MGIKTPRKTSVWSFLLGQLLLPFICCSFALNAFAASPRIQYQGRILKPNGEPLQATNVKFRLQILTPNTGSCVMYDELKDVNMSGSGGTFSLNINDGLGTRTDSTGLDLDRIFANRGTFSFAPATCADSNTTYTPGLDAGRRFRVSFNDGSGWSSIPDMEISMAPYAIESMQLSGFKAENFLRVVDGSGVPQSLSPISPTQHTELLALIGGTSTQYQRAGQFMGGNLPMGTMAHGYALRMGSSGTWEAYDPASGGGGSGTVTSVVAGTGLSGGNIISSGTISLAAIGTVGTGYKITYDEYGRVTASAAIAEADIPTITTAGKVSGDAITSGTIGGTTSMSTSGTVTASQVSTRGVYISNLEPKTISILAPAAITGSGYTLTLPDSAGTTGQVLTTNGTGGLSWTSPAGGSVTSVGGTAPIQVTGTSTVTVSVDDATTSAKGVVQLATSGGTMAGHVVQANDPRLSDARTTSGTAGGDLTDSYPVPTVAAIRNVAVNAAAPSGAGQVLRYNGTTEYTPAYLSLADIRSTTGPTYAQTFPSTSCTAKQTLTWSSITDTLTCSDIALTAADITGSVVNGGQNGAVIVGTNDLNTLTLETNNTARLTIGTAGNVGIGTATPGQKLDVNGSAQATRILTGNGTNAAPSYSFTNATDFGLTYNSSNVSVDLVAAGTAQFSIVDGSLLGTGGNGAPLINRASGSNSAPTYTFKGPAGWSDTGMYAPAIGTLGFTTAGAERLRITSTGNVGIGTSSPAGRLHIVDSSSGNPTIFASSTVSWAAGHIRSDNDQTDSTHLYTWGSAYAARTALQRNSELQADNSLYLTAGANNPSGAMAFLTGGSTPGTNTRMTITANGSVGIGTTTPTQKLDVVGNINATQLCIAGDCKSAWPSVGGSGTVTSISATNGLESLSGAAITGAGTIGLADTTVSAGSFGTASSVPAFNVDAKGRLTGVTNINIGNLNASVLTAGTLDAARLPAFTGDVTTAGGSAVTTLATTGVSAATYRSVTVDAKGRVTAGTNPTTLAGYGITDAVINGGQNGAVTVGTNDASNLSLSSNNAVRVTIGASGNVGIGTNSPTGPFHVVGGSAPASTGGAPITITGQNATGPSGGQGGDINLTTGLPAGGGGWQMGYVNIEAARTNLIRGENATYTGSSASVPYPNGPMMLQNSFGQDGNSALQTFQVRNSTPRIQYGYFGAVSEAGTDYTPNLVWGQSTGAGSYVERMRIDAAGNVGIGVLAPARLLHVNGAMRINPTALPGSPAAGDIAVDSSAANALKYYNGSSWVSAGGSGSSTAGSNTQIQFNSSGTLGASANFVWDNTNSRLGIGAAAPTSDLSFGGAVARTIAVETEAAANHGKDLTVKAGNGGANSNRNGGDLNLSSGSATGNGYSSVNLLAVGGAQGTGTTARPASVVASFGGPNRSYAIGFNVTSSGLHSIAMGDAARSYGHTSVAIGQSVETYGDYSLALGQSATVSGNNSVGIGLSSGTFNVTANNAMAIMGGSVGIAKTTPGAELDVLGTIRLSGSSSGYVGLRPAAAAGNTTYTLPAADGTAGQILKTDGAGIMSWVSASSAPISLAANRLIGTGVSGTAMEAVSCSVGNVISFDGSGNWICSAPTALTGVFVNGGNTLTATGTLGTNSNHSLQIETNNTTRMTVTAGGSIGIGTSSPAALLDVSGNASFDGMVTSWGGFTTQGNVNTAYTSSGATGFPYSGASTSSTITASNTQAVDGGAAFIHLFARNSNNINQNGYIGVSSNAGGATDTPNLVFGQSTASGYNERMRINVNGNVGIGTTNPTDALHVARSGAAFVTVQSTGSNGSGFTASSTSGNNTYNGFYSGGAASGSRQKYIGNMGGTLVFGRSDDSWSTNYEQMVILNNGNVGIGTVSPSDKLHIVGSANAQMGLTLYNGSAGTSAATLTQFYNDDASGAIGVFPATSSNAAYADRMVMSTNADASGMTFNTPGSQDIRYRLNGAEAMRITSTGSVGIGVTSPARLLHVNGPMRMVASAVPASPATGDLFIDNTDSNKLKWYNGSGWQTAGGGGGGTPAGSNTQVQFNSSGTLGASTNFVWDNTNSRLGVGTASPDSPLHISTTANSGRVMHIVNSGTGTSAIAEAEFGNGSWSNSTGIGGQNHSDARLQNRGYLFSYSPGLSLVAEANTNATDMRFYTGATPAAERMRITGTGSIGIGTTSPARLLHVAGPMRITPAALPSSPAAGDLAFDSSAGNVLKYHDGSGWQTLVTGSDFTRYTWDGDTSYSQTAVGDEGVPFGARNSFFNTNALDNTAAIFQFGARNTAGTYQNAYMGAVSNTAGDSPTIVFGQTTNAVTSTYTERMRIAASGNVGIGTVSPNHTLTIQQRTNSGIFIQGSVGVNSGNGSFSIYDAGGASQWSIAADSSGKFQLYDDLNGKGPFAIDSNSPADSLRIRSTGNVGIGVASPSAKLQVAGQIVSNESVLASGATANFNNGNSIVLQSVGGTAITVSNMVAGGVYNVVIEDTTSRTYTFSGCGTSYFSPANGATTNRSVYTIYRRGSSACYITWVTGFN